MITPSSRIFKLAVIRLSIVLCFRNDRMDIRFEDEYLDEVGVE